MEAQQLKVIYDLVLLSISTLKLLKVLTTSSTYN